MKTLHVDRRCLNQLPLCSKRHVPGLNRLNILRCLHAPLLFGRLARALTFWLILVNDSEYNNLQKTCVSKFPNRILSYYHIKAYVLFQISTTHNIVLSHQDYYFQTIITIFHKWNMGFKFQKSNGLYTLFKSTRQQFSEMGSKSFQQQFTCVCPRRLDWVIAIEKVGLALVALARHEKRRYVQYPSRSTGVVSVCRGVYWSASVIDLTSVETMPARLGAHWESGLQAPVCQLYSLLRFYCPVGIFRGVLAKRTRYDRVAVHPRALEPGSFHQI